MSGLVLTNYREARPDLTAILSVARLNPRFPQRITRRLAGAYPQLEERIGPGTARADG
jgi:hypothetical protein